MEWYQTCVFCTAVDSDGPSQVRLGRRVDVVAEALSGRTRLRVLGKLALLQTGNEAIVESAFAAMKHIADDRVARSVQPAALERQLVLKRDELPWHLADVADATLLYEEQRRRGARWCIGVGGRDGLYFCLYIH